MTDIDITKPIRTKDGKPVEIITDKGRGRFSLLGYIGDREFPDKWARDGKYYINRSSLNDIENVPERREVFYNVYDGGGCSSAYKTKEAALSKNRINCSDYAATIRLTLEGDRLVSVDLVEKFGEDGDE